jgi:hypothetical protein
MSNFEFKKTLSYDTIITLGVLLVGLILAWSKLDGRVTRLEDRVEPLWQVYNQGHQR